LPQLGEWPGADRQSVRRASESGQVLGPQQAHCKQEQGGFAEPFSPIKPKRPLGMLQAQLSEWMRREKE